jgi:hypothetical protein
MGCGSSVSASTRDQGEQIVVSMAESNPDIGGESLEEGSRRVVESSQSFSQSNGHASEQGQLDFVAPTISEEILEPGTLL